MNKNKKKNDIRLVNCWNNFHDVHTQGSVCAKYESVWSKHCESVLATKCTLGLYVHYVQVGLGLHKDPQLV